jgi:GAF domain-containing protein/N-acetylglutamate synthase-like GNAT family acetyltransferase
VVDTERGEIRPAAAWFASEDAWRAFAPLLARPYDERRAGVTEAAIERGRALVIPRVEDWAGAPALRERLGEGLDTEHAELAWEWYRSASFISCPVRTAGGRMLGVLVISSNPPRAPLSAEHLRAVEVFARLAALALERSELLERESEHAHEEQLLNRAWQAVAGSLEPAAVYSAIIDEAATLTGATKVLLRRFDPTAGELRCVANAGFSDAVAGTRVRPGEGMLGQVALTGEPYLSREEDRDRFLERVISTEGIESFVHVPVALGGRLFGVLTAAHGAAGHFGEQELRRLIGLARGAAAAIANALDFQRERRIVNALTRGFVPVPPAALTGYEVGLVYEPVGHDVGGGDLFGVWRRPDGALAVLLGDVSGKGLEVAAMSAMVRFFVEARAFDTESPAEVLGQTNRILRGRLPAAGFATAFLAIVAGEELRFCNAGHPPPRILRADGGEQELTGCGPPLGVEPDQPYAEHAFAFGPGDTLFAATDGLLESRRERRFFGDARLPALLAEHGRTLAPQPLAELVHTEAERWAAKRHDDVAVLVVRRALATAVRPEPADGPAAQALFGEYMALVRERLGPAFEPHEAIFANERSFEEPGAAFLLLYAGEQAVACGGLRVLAPDVAEIKRMFVTAGARRRGHGRRLLAELEALAAAAGARRVRLLTTEVLTEARAMYAAAGYRELETFVRDGRRDAWLEKEL